GSSLFGERPRQHEFGFEDGSCLLHSAVEGRHHPGNSECLTRCWTSVTRRPVLRSYQERLSSSVAAPSCTTKLPDRSSGFASPRFSRQSWIKAASSLPMMMRASEPPMKARRVSPAFVHMVDFMASSIAKDRV